MSNFRGEVNIKEYNGKIEDLPVGEIAKGLICPKGRKSIRASGGEVRINSLMENERQEKICVVKRNGKQEIFGANIDVLSIVMK